MRNVWPDASSNEANITQHVSTIRKALAKDRIIDISRPFRGIGYRFVANVRELPWGSRERITTSPLAYPFTTEDRGETSAAISHRAFPLTFSVCCKRAVDATVGQLNLRRDYAIG